MFLDEKWLINQVTNYYRTWKCCYTITRNGTQYNIADLITNVCVISIMCT